MEDRMTASYQAEQSQGAEQSLPFRKNSHSSAAEMALQLAPGVPATKSTSLLNPEGKREDRSRQNGLPTIVCKLPHVGKTINRNRGNRNFRDGGGRPDLRSLQQVAPFGTAFLERQKGSGALSVKRNRTWPVRSAAKLECAKIYCSTLFARSSPLNLQSQFEPIASR
jgi:hypothetical protein